MVKIITSPDKLKQLFHIPLYSNALYLMTANATNALLGFAFWLIVARSYSPEDVGLASAAISAVSLLAMLASLGLGYGLIRFLPRSNQNFSRMINSCFSLGSLASLAAVFIFLAGINLWSPALLFIRNNPAYLASFVIFNLASVLTQLTNDTFIAERRAGFVLANCLVFNILRLPLPILLAVSFHAIGIFASWGVSLGVALVLSLFLFLPRAQPGYRLFPCISRSLIGEMLRFSIANHFSALFWAAPSLVLPIMVVNLLGAETNAYFYVAWAVGSVLSVIPTAVSMSLFAEGSYAEEKFGINIWRSLKMVFIILAPAILLIVVFADKVLLLFGISYSESATALVRILALCSLPLAVNIIYLGIKRVERNLRAIVGLAASITVVTLGLAYFLLPNMGINGGGIAWLIGQGVTALWITLQWLRKRI